MTDRLRVPRVPRVPPHVIVMLSATTAGYAVTLAGVAALQAADEAAVMADRAPVAEDVAALVAGHDQLAVRLESAREDYARAADAYVRAAAVLEVVDRDLAGLASTVAEIDGVSRSLPTSVRQPVQRAVIRVTAPTTHATTSASGG